MWEYFLDTEETIGEGRGFSLFDLTHVSWLVGITAFVLIMVFFYQRNNLEARRKILFWVAILLILDELFKVVLLLYGGNYMWGYMPLHLCSINIFIILAHAIKPSKFKAEFLYSLCLPGAAVALIFPGWSSLPFANFLHIHSFTVHALLLVYPILLLVGGFRPNFRLLPKVFLLLALMASSLYVLNKILNTNFMFLNHPGTGNPLVFFEQWFGNPGYIMGYFILLPIVWGIMYLPYNIHVARKRQISKE